MLRISRSVMLAVAGSSLFVASSAMAQGLSERIAHVQARGGLNAKSKNETKSQMLGALLYNDITVDFTETPAREAIKYIQTLLGVNIIGRYMDDANSSGEGIDPEQPVSLSVANKPALNVLEMILDQVGSDDVECTWQLRDGYVEVGPKDRLAVKRAQEIRYYPIRDLLFEPVNFDNAPDFDLDRALQQGNQNGQGGGGSGGGGFGGGGGGFGGGGGGGGSGGGGFGGGGFGGSLFDQPDGDIERPTEEEQAEELITLIMESIEPDAWTETGGDWATIRYYQGTLIVRAPDFIHRQLGGYPFSPRATGMRAEGTPVDRRYVTFSAPLSNVQIIGFGTAPAVGTVGGGGNP